MSFHRLRAVPRRLGRHMQKLLWLLEELHLILIVVAVVITHRLSGVARVNASGRDRS